MDKRELANIQADTPLQITDGAPNVININGAECRIPATMDYRIVNKVAEVCEIDDFDQSALLMYCCLHAKPKQIKELWKQARNPNKLVDKLVMWQASQNAETLTSGINELMELLGEDEPDNNEMQNDDGKKKTTAQ